MYDPATEGTFSTSALRDKAEAHIQEQIIAHKSIIRYYHERHNALTVTCRIPPEILATIFGEVAKYAQNASSSYEKKYTVKGAKITWIPKVSHVCSHWRAVALSAFDLWTNIPIGNPSWATEMIQRSKAAPLTIAYRGVVYPRHASTVESTHTLLKNTLRSHLSRVKNLALEIRSDYGGGNQGATRKLFAELLTILEQPAPMLERFEIRKPLSSTETDASGPRSKASLINAIITGSPRLTHLDMYGCAIAWETPAFRHLKSLAVSRLPEQARPSVAHLLGLLSQTPLLETLSIDTIQASHGILPPDSVTVDLGRLERLTIGGDVPTCTSLFGRLILSNRARNIVLHLTSTRPDFDSASMKSLAQKFEREIEGAITKVELGSVIRCWKPKFPDVQTEPEDPVISIFFDNKSSASRLAFLQSLSRDGIQFLDFETTIIDEDTLLLFADLPILKHLRCISNEYLWLKLLRRGTAAKRNSPAVRPYFASLRCLTIIDWAMDATQAGKDVAKWLTTCFRLRKKAGLGLQLLEIEECTAVDEEDVERLRKCIDKVVWDGSGDVNEDDDSEEEECDLSRTLMWKAHSLPTAAPRAVAEAYIDEQTTNYKAIIRYYNERRNSLTATCRIPSEVLVKTFKEVIDCTKTFATAFRSDYNYSGQPWRHPNIGWIPNMSHVCAHWREVALSTPDLWSNIPIEIGKHSGREKD
ncbi:hypothetical protein DXG01_008288 [Tephrocybe rancida]|nr:hypothetical protein DXG01_008288 [Tephrocybe rancida]